MSAGGPNYWVFRDGRRTVAGTELVARLADELLGLESGNPSAVTAALISAGELECALADTASPDAALAGSITDLLAARLVNNGNENPSDNLLSLLPRLRVPERARLSPPEGFAYYALHPRDYAAVVARLPASTFAAVIGIRSIGTTLSAVVAAALAAQHTWAERISVRPAGDPYDRVTSFTDEQKRWIATQRARRAEFVVVDEGPGLSGSSFLSVGEALVSAGVPRTSITFLCSRQPDPRALVARDAAARWAGFRVLCAGEKTCLPPDTVDVSAGQWRRLWFRDPAAQPASWTHMERMKLLSTDGRWLYKFQGLGRYGAEVRERDRLLGDAGFGVAPAEDYAGFARYPVLSFEPLSRRDLSREMIRWIAEYCAFRATAFPGSGEREPLEEVVRCNVRTLFGAEIELPEDALGSANPVLVDGRMLPHEWVRSGDGVKKIDASTHGDDHFFPGPTDIAWDLAGAIIEWQMDNEVEAALLAEFRRAGGDDVRGRLPAYLLAYSVFRAAYCRMAAHAMRGSEEHDPLIAAAQHYEIAARRWLGHFAAAETVRLAG